MQIAVLTVRQRQRVCDLVAMGVRVTAAALVVGCSRQTASKWVNRRRRDESLHDRSSRPHSFPRRTPAAVEQAILRARAELREGPHLIGWALGIAASTVQAVLFSPRSLATGHPAGARADHPLRASLARRARARRHQEAEPDRATRPSCDRRSLAKSRGCRLALPVRSDRRSLPTRLRRRPPATRQQTRRSPSSRSSLASTARTASASSEYSPTTAAASSVAGRMRASSTRSPSRRRAPIARRPTARPNALSARCSSAGRTPTPTSTSQSVWLLLAQHSTSTIASVPTAHLEASHPCSASTTSLGHTTRQRSGHRVAF